MEQEEIVTVEQDICLEGKVICCHSHKHANSDDDRGRQGP